MKESISKLKYKQTKAEVVILISFKTDCRLQSIKKKKDTNRHFIKLYNFTIKL